ncbi:MAG TPA: 50S ribosomal protein L24e [bacterium]|nr:50S ribosomal protein L24e [bacterium]
MVRIVECSFCGKKINPGSLLLYVRTDGTILRFCSRKCKHNMLYLKRRPQKLKWTNKYIKVKG